jgi:hypothetical protein
MMRAYVLGWREADGDIGMTYDGTPFSPRSQAYDLGRNHHRQVWALAFAWRTGVDTYRDEIAR